MCRFYLVRRDVRLTLEIASCSCSREQGKSVRPLGREAALGLGGSLDILKLDTAAPNIAQDRSVPSAGRTWSP